MAETTWSSIQDFSHFTEGIGNGSNLVSSVAQRTFALPVAPNGGSCDIGSKHTTNKSHASVSVGISSFTTRGANESKTIPVDRDSKGDWVLAIPARAPVVTPGHAIPALSRSH
jgi:hypothetical protein